MPRILFIGSTGFVGGATLYALINEFGHAPSSITLLVRSASKAQPLVDSFPGLKVAEGALSNTKLVEGLAADAEVVINVAHDISTDSAEQEGINAGLKAIIAGLDQRPAGGFYIHTSGAAGLYSLPSSSHVWNDIDDLATIRSFPSDVLHADQDRLVLGATPAHPKVRTVIVSPPAVLGLSPSPLSPLPFFVPAIASAIKTFGAGFVVGDGSQQLSSVNVRDLARLYGLMLAEAMKPQGGAVVWGKDGYYFGSDRSGSWRDFVEPYVKAIARKGLIPSEEIKSIKIEEAAGLHPIFDILMKHGVIVGGGKARLLGWEPREKPLELEECLEVYLKDGTGKPHADKRFQ